jgi:hypothetical protein
MAEDVQITITRETGAVTQAGFGLPLILGTSANENYAEFTDLESVGVVWGSSSEEYAIASAIFGQSPTLPKIAMAGVPYDNGTDSPTVLTDFLNTLIDEGNDDFYFVVSPEQTDAEILALAEWANGTGRMYFVSTDDMTIPGQLEYDRAVVLVHKSPDTYPAEAWIGKCAPQDPGSITWKFKQLSGIGIPGYTTTEIGNIHDDGGNTYVRKLGYNQTSEGLATDSTFIDIVRSQDFIKARLTESLSQLLYNSPKVPYDVTGIGQVVATIDGVLKRAVDQGIIAVDTDGNGLYTVTAPDRNDISDVDVANRLLPDVEFEFTLAGAIHNIEVKGVISL